ncbi:DUF262 and DUF1524 domain-containing protein [Mesorhizobium opportunistum]
MGEMCVAIGGNMKASEVNLLKFIRKSPQFVIPIYQRNYSWNEVQCRQLWRDLMLAGSNDGINAHFIGAIVYVERALSTVASQEALLVIDGQQRLTTSTLLIAALAKHFEENRLEEILESFSARKLKNYYLLNPDESGERHYKLLLSEADRETMLALLREAPLPAESSTRVLENFKLFQSLIVENANKLEAICKGLSKLVIVEVALDRSQDNPQLIFESMNSTGLELSQADLIRNFILMGLEPRLQTELYTSYWRPMEKAFGQAAYTSHFDAFMRHYLTTKTGEIPNVRQVYLAFKSYAQRFKGNVSDLVAEIHSFATYYCAMALDAEKDYNLNQAFRDLRELKVDVSYPFLLDVYHDYRNGLLELPDVIKVVRLVESYVFRRAICSFPTNSLNKTFSQMSRTLDKSRYLESLQASFMMQPSYRRFPSDAEFERDFKVRDLYNFRSRSYWLRRLENHGRRERVMVEDYTIEHILPQNPDISSTWKAELGKDWQSVHQTYLHTLGNLTLSAYNSEYSDRPFAIKRDQIKDKDGNSVGLAFSPLKLNQGLGQVQVWNEISIKARADRLAAESTKVWGAPELKQEVLDTFRPPAPVVPAHIYTIEDHPNLSPGPIQDLFFMLRKSILSLDPAVTEEFWKVYVAYKAETNFVDVVPQTKALRLSINVPFHEIEDPKNACIDVSNLGRWGNGDVELKISGLDDLPYAMGMIRQAFDRQMGSTADMET